MLAPRASFPMALLIGLAVSSLTLEIVVSDGALSVERAGALAKGGNGGGKGGGNGNGGNNGNGNGGNNGNGNGSSGNAGSASGQATSESTVSENASLAATALARRAGSLFQLRPPPSEIRPVREKWAKAQKLTTVRASRAKAMQATQTTAGRSRTRGIAADRARSFGRETNAAASSTKGAPTINRRAVVASGLSEADIQRLSDKGLRVVSRSASSGSAVVRLALPRKVSAAAARRLISDVNRDAVSDADAYYYTDEGPRGCDGRSCVVSLIQWQPPSACGAPPAIGIIDTKVDLNHEALRGQNIEVVTLVPSPSASGPEHGTAIAALLAGRADSDAPGLLPQVRLVAVDAFGVDDGEERTDVVRIAAALEELARRGVKIVNLSFTGPPNDVLRQAIGQALARGMILVAAAGNGGPGAEPSYPAAYPGVIAVTAVDAELRVYRRASRGDYITLAAPGVGVPTAKAGGGEVIRSGTSFAAPFVSAAVARLIAREPRTGEVDAAERLSSMAQDLGKPGRDPVFGAGLLQTAGLCDRPPGEPPVAMATEKNSGSSVSRREE